MKDPSQQTPYQPFLDFLRYEKRYATHTLLSYEKDLHDFVRYLEDTYEIKRPAQVTTAMIRSWLVFLKEKELSARSINRKLSALRSWFKYLTRLEKIARNPVLSVQGMKSGKRLPVYVERRAMDTLLHQLDFPDTFSGHTERLILELLYETGMRRSELVHLETRNVDWSAAQLKVLGKGNKERILPLSPGLLKKIKTYLAEKERLPQSDSTVLLVTPGGRRLYDQYVYRVVKKWLSVITTADKKSPHVLRHTFATHLTNNGADLNAVKELLGHAGLAATQIYTHNSIAQLKAIYEQAHPKSGK